jgi:hypothetical protein
MLKNFSSVEMETGPGLEQGSGFGFWEAGLPYIVLVLASCMLYIPAGLLFYFYFTLSLNYGCILGKATDYVRR